MKLFTSMRNGASGIGELSERSREIFRLIVDTYVETGEPVGSRTLSRRLAESLSPATIRNVMADLEDLGLLYAPHTSAGRLPTDAGLELFVNGLLEIGDLDESERARIDAECQTMGKSLDTALEEATTMLAGLSGCAGLVMAPAKQEAPLRHIEFVHLGPGRALVVIVTADGMVENRVVDLPAGIPPSALIEASNYLNTKLEGLTIAEAMDRIDAERKADKDRLDKLAENVVRAGLATWSGGEKDRASLIVKGQMKLLDDITALEDLERIRNLFNALEAKERLVKLLDLAHEAQGVQIFIGAHNELFNMSGCSMIVAPYHNSKQKILGAIGVIGPTRMNYARIIPLVDYTSKVIGRLMT